MGRRARVMGTEASITGGRADSVGTRPQMTDRGLKRQLSKGNKPRAKSSCGWAKGDHQ